MERPVHSWIITLPTEIEPLFTNAQPFEDPASSSYKQKKVFYNKHTLRVMDRSPCWRIAPCKPVLTGGSKNFFYATCREEGFSRMTGASGGRGRTQPPASGATVCVQEKGLVANLKHPPPSSSSTPLPPPRCKIYFMTHVVPVHFVPSPHMTPGSKTQIPRMLSHIIPATSSHTAEETTHF